MELQTVDLASVGTDEKKPVEFAGQPRLVILDNHPSVELRLNQRGAPALPAVRGDEYCLEEGIGKVYVTNPLQVEAELRLLVLRQDEVATLESEAGVNGGGSVASIAQERLSGNLDDGTTISSGEEIAETVDTEGADQVRARARVDGISDFQEVADDTSGSNAWGAVYDEANERVFVNEQGSDVVEYDVSTPGSPSEVDRLTLSTANGNKQQQRPLIALDRANDRLVVTGRDGVGPVVWVVDVSTPGTMVDDGNASLPDEPLRFGNAAVHEGSSRAFLPLNGELAKVDVSGAPNVETSVWGNSTTGVGVDQSRDLLFFVEGNTLRINSVSGSGGVGLVGSISFGGFSFGGGEKIYPDEGREIVLFGLQNDSTFEQHLFAVDYSIASSPAEIDREPISNSGSNREAFHVIVDDTGAEPVVWTHGENNAPWNRFVYGPSTIRPIASVHTGGDALGPPATYSASGQFYLFEAQQGGDNWQLWSGIGGAVDLKIIPLSPDGGRVVKGRSSVVTLTDGAEGMVTLDLVGEEAVDVVLENRGSQQGTIQYVDVTQEPV